jgi:hypothetical protein
MCQFFRGCDSGFGWRCDFAHHGVDLAGGYGHDDPLDGADFFVRDVLFPGHAKVMFDSWLAFPGHRRGQADHGSGSRVEAIITANGIVKVAIGFVLVRWQHAATLSFYAVKFNLSECLAAGDEPRKTRGCRCRCNSQSACRFNAAGRRTATCNRRFATNH